MNPGTTPAGIARTLGLRLAPVVMVVCLLQGCATQRPPTEIQPVPRPGAGVATDAELQGRLLAAASKLDSSDFPTQRVFTMKLDAPEGAGTLRLLLLLESPSRFRLQAHDRILNRRVWGLDVEAERGVALDHRAKTYCEIHGDHVEIRALPLGPLPWSNVPRLLLGQLPLEPASSPEWAASPDTSQQANFLDAWGRRVDATFENTMLSQWRVTRDAQARVFYQVDGADRVLSAPEEQLQLRWRERRLEPLSQALGPLELPARYESHCP